MSVIQFPNMTKEDIEIRVEMQTERSLLLEFEEFFLSIKKFDGGHYKLDVIWHNDLQENIFHFWRNSDRPNGLDYSYGGDNWREDRKKIFWHLIKSIWTMIIKYDDQFIFQNRDLGHQKLSWKTK